MKFIQGQLPCDLILNDNIYQLLKAHYELHAAYVWAGADPELDFKGSLNAKLDFGGPSLSLHVKSLLTLLFALGDIAGLGKAMAPPAPLDEPLRIGMIVIEHKLATMYLGSNAIKVNPVPFDPVFGDP